MILAGDIGGTKTILALYEEDKNGWFCHQKKNYASADFDTFSALLDNFLVINSYPVLDSVCIGVAGPIINGDCTTTNLPWILKNQAIASQTGVKQVDLLNDLEATAWGILDLSDDNFVELNPVAKKSKIGHMAVLAAGTGLGEALIIHSNEKYHVVATEGGHTDFAPRNELEIGLLYYLMALYPEHVSYERVVCGQGLTHIYQYLKSIHYAPINEQTELSMGKNDPAAVIGEKGIKGNDLLCVKTLEIFCEIYGAEAGNLALKCLPSGGIFLAGGIVIKILSSMQNGYFIQGFLAKGRYQSVLKDISIKVCLNSEAALIGAAYVAKKVN